jgi:hypothetical protein
MTMMNKINLNNKLNLNLNLNLNKNKNKNNDLIIIKKSTHQRCDEKHHNTLIEKDLINQFICVIRDLKYFSGYSYDIRYKEEQIKILLREKKIIIMKLCTPIIISTIRESVVKYKKNVDLTTIE